MLGVFMYKYSINDLPNAFNDYFKLLLWYPWLQDKTCKWYQSNIKQKHFSYHSVWTTGHICFLFFSFFVFFLFFFFFFFFNSIVKNKSKTQKLLSISGISISKTLVQIINIFFLSNSPLFCRPCLFWLCFVMWLLDFLFLFCFCFCLFVFFCLFFSCFVLFCFVLFCFVLLLLLFFFFRNNN